MFAARAGVTTGTCRYIFIWTRARSASNVMKPLFSVLTSRSSGMSLWDAAGRRPPFDAPSVAASSGPRKRSAHKSLSQKRQLAQTQTTPPHLLSLAEGLVRLRQRIGSGNLEDAIAACGRVAKL